MLNLRCGDDLRSSLARSGVPGGFAAWTDPVCQGPTPAGHGPAEWRRVRAGFLNWAYGVPRPEAVARLAAEDRILTALGEEDEVVLWFEHDLYDQAALIQLLSRLRNGPQPQRLSLVTLDRHASVERFVGLGQLDPADLADLFARREPITPGMFEAAGRAWAAFTSPDPTDLAALARTGLPELPYLAAALSRHLAELPGAEDGLGGTERLALEELSRGPMIAAALFGAVQQREPVPWLGDTMFHAILRGMLDGSRPLVSGQGWNQLARPAEAVLRLSEAGAEVLAGHADQVSLNGVDRWVGGVHLAGLRVKWRWDRAEARLVAG